MKKEIVIDGKASDWFEKATFVLKKDGEQRLPKDLFSYAEEIVEKHLKKMPQQAEQIRPMQNRYSGTGSMLDLQQQYGALRLQKELIKKRAKYVNSFFMISLITCAVSLIVLILSNFS